MGYIVHIYHSTRWQDNQHLYILFDFDIPGLEPNRLAQRILVKIKQILIFYLSYPANYSLNLNNLEYPKNIAGAGNGVDHNVDNDVSQNNYHNADYRVEQSLLAFFRRFFIARGSNVLVTADYYEYHGQGSGHKQQKANYPINKPGGSG